MDCIEFRATDLAHFSQGLRSQRLPLNGGIELTQRCNLRCVHCYCRHAANNEAMLAAELSYEEVCHIVDQVADEGCLGFLITGGEPLVRRDFLDIYDYVRDKGILVTLFTNATLMTPRIADHLAERPPLLVEVSLYGPTRELYESVTDIPGSFDRCMRGIDLLAERGLRVTLKTPAMVQNVDHLNAVEQLAASKGLESRFGTIMQPRYEGMDDREGPYRYALTLEQIVALESSLGDGLEARRDYVERLLGQPRPETLFACGAGHNSFFIDYEGNLLMCMSAREPKYDLRNGSFRQGWHEFLPQVRRTLLPPDSPCRECNVYMFCNQCPARSQLEFGVEEQGREIEWVCRLAHLRAEAFANLGTAAPSG